MRRARALVREEHFVVNEKDHTVNLTDAGIRAAEKLAGVESFYTVGNMEWPHLLDNALKAHHSTNGTELCRQGWTNHHR